MTLLQARWSYTALATDELSFKEGDCITLVKKWNDDWWEGGTYFILLFAFLLLVDGADGTSDGKKRG